MQNFGLGTGNYTVIKVLSFERLFFEKKKKFLRQNGLFNFPQKGGDLIEKSANLVKNLKYLLLRNN